MLSKAPEGGHSWKVPVMLETCSFRFLRKFIPAGANHALAMGVTWSFSTPVMFRDLIIFFLQSSLQLELHETGKKYCCYLNRTDF